MSTDGSILPGFAAQNEGDLKVVGEAFSEERIGVGYPQGPTRRCASGSTASSRSPSTTAPWAEAFELTLGPSGVETPDPPALDECQPDRR